MIIIMLKLFRKMNLNKYVTTVELVLWESFPSANSYISVLQILFVDSEFIFPGKKINIFLDEVILEILKANFFFFFFC